MHRKDITKNLCLLNKFNIQDNMGQGIQEWTK